MPLFEIPDPRPYAMSNPPLAQALAQVRFPLIAEFETMAGIAPIQKELRDAFPYMEQEKVQQLQFVIGPAGPAGAGAAESITWKLSDDAGNVLVVSAGSATLSAGQGYTTVDEFSMAFRRLLSALASVRVPRCDRLGVRYLSLANDLPGEERSWRRWFRPEVIGWAGSDVVSDARLASAMNQVQLTHPPAGPFATYPGEVQVLVRHGAVPAGTAVQGIPPVDVSTDAYLLDLDVFVVGPQPFDPDRLTDQFTQLHDQIDRFFYWSLTEEGCAHFGLKYRD